MSTSNVAGVHVGMKEVVIKNLGKERFNTFVRQHLKVHTCRTQGINLANGHAVDPFHHQHMTATELAVDPGYIEQRRVGKVAA